MLFRPQAIELVTQRLKRCADEHRLVMRTRTPPPPCSKNSVSSSNELWADRAIREELRKRQLTVANFSFVVLRLSRMGDWEAALEVLKSPVARQERLIRDDGLWHQVSASLPNDKARDAALPVLKHVFSATNMKVFPSRGPKQ